MAWSVTLEGFTYTNTMFENFGYTTYYPQMMQSVANIGATAQTIVSGTNFGNSFRNRLRNSTFLVNQRAVSGTVTIAVGVYGHDGWKAGSAGASYTFARSGGVTTITGAGSGANTLVQVIEGIVYLNEGGTFTLWWQGTALGRVNGGAYAASPIVVTGLTADAPATIEFDLSGGKTLSLPQFERGNKATVFEYRDDEARRCRRYYRVVSVSLQGVASGGGSGNRVALGYDFGEAMRAAPTLALGSVAAASNCTASVQTPATTSFCLNLDPTAAGQYYYVSGQVICSAEL